MKFADVLQIIFYCALLIGLTLPLSALMYKVFEGQKTFLTPVLGWLERALIIV